MIETPVRTSGASDAENLRAELARSDALAGTVLPILRHLLSSNGSTLFGDEVLARVRSMLAHLASALVAAIHGDDAAPEVDRQQVAALSEALLASHTLVAHLHAQALEWALTERLEIRCGVDPVISPLLERWITDVGAPMHALATRLLAAQAKWCQSQRRMALALSELPGEALHAALLTLRAALPGDARVELAEARIRAAYDEGATRLGLAARLVIALGGDAHAALELEDAGATLFITALALHAGEARDTVAVSMHETQTIRLALALIAAGLSPQAAERQIELLHEHVQVAPCLQGIDMEQAIALLQHPRSDQA